MQTASWYIFSTEPTYPAKSETHVLMFITYCSVCSYLIQYCLLLLLCWQLPVTIYESVIDLVDKEVCYINIVALML